MKVQQIQLDLADAVLLNLNLTLLSIYSRELTPFHQAIGRCL